MMAEQTLMEISGSGCPHRACPLALDGGNADISISTSAIPELRILSV
jgi:hypothetical protein